MINKSKNKNLWGSYIPFTFNRSKTVSIIIGEAKKRKHIVYGAQAMNIQLNPAFRRITPDVDLYAKNPKKSAQRTQKILDKKVAGGHDDFFMRPAIHRGTFKVMHEGKDGKKNTSDDINVADYTKQNNQIKTVVINGVRYESINSISQGKQRTLRDKKSKYRHEKDKNDLERINLNKNFTKE
jgi:hypothetical protein